MPCMLAPLCVFTDRCPLPVGSFHLRVFVCVRARAHGIPQTPCNGPMPGGGHGWVGSWGNLSWAQAVGGLCAFHPAGHGADRRSLAPCTTGWEGTAPSPGCGQRGSGAPECRRLPVGSAQSRECARRGQRWEVAPAGRSSGKCVWGARSGFAPAELLQGRFRNEDLRIQSLCRLGNSRTVQAPLWSTVPGPHALQRPQK